MAPKRPAAASGSASEASDAEADAGHHQPSSPSPSKTPPPPNPNPKSTAAGPTSAAEDSTAAGSGSEAAYDSDADHRTAPRNAASPSSKPRSTRPRSRSRSRSPDAASYSDGVASDADADPAAVDGADSADDGNASPLAPPRPSRAEAAAVKPISSRPMDPPRRSMVPSFSEQRSKRPRSVAVPSSVEHLKRPTRLWSLHDEIVILRGLATYRAKRGVLPGSTYDISKLHGRIRSELSVKVTTTQLGDKVRRLKQKYNLLASRGKSGRDPDLPSQHEQSVYEIGKKVWGGSANGGGSTGGDGYEIGGDSEEEHEFRESDEDVENGRDERARKNRRVMPIAMANGNGAGLGAVKANSRGKFDTEKGKDAYPYLWETVEDLSKEHPNGVAFKKAFESIEGPKARGMEEKLRKFRLTEIRHQLRRMELMKETVKMVLDALEG
ncbi:GLABROUS1 enhancer-binding protein-like [Zea mays]|jgi:hypothetical protein|uniref:GLABROUS1 enhancer-binding protein-like n=2 Tax=Zea mays TaxID=4577 RepID=B4G1M3_MAIZE|eukprot:NP_001144670.1 GLABROUS1 enhancer-binding protein-like [Zea mays]